MLGGVHGLACMYVTTTKYLISLFLHESFKFVFLFHCYSLNFLFSPVAYPDLSFIWFSLAVNLFQEHSQTLNISWFSYYFCNFSSTFLTLFARPWCLCHWSVCWVCFSLTPFLPLVIQFLLNMYYYYPFTSYLSYQMTIFKFPTPVLKSAPDGKLQFLMW